MSVDFAERLKEMQPWLTWSIKRKQQELNSRLKPLVLQEAEEQNTSALLHDLERAWMTLSQPELTWDPNALHQLLRCALALSQKLQEHQGLAPLIDVFFDQSINGQHLAQSLDQWLKHPEKRSDLQGAISAFLLVRQYKLQGVMERYSSWPHALNSLYKGAWQICSALATQAQTALQKQ